MSNPKVFLYYRYFALFLLATGLAAVFAACGDAPAPQVVVPTATPTPSFRQEVNQELFFIMSIPNNWAKNGDKDMVAYVAPEDANLKISVSATSAQRLTADSTRILQEKLDTYKTRFTNFRQDNAGLLKLVDATINLFKLTYTEAGTEISEFTAQVNAPSSNRAYILSGRSLAAQAEQRKSTFTTAFESFKSNAPLAVPATLTAAAGGDPTAVAASAGGKVTGNKGTTGKTGDLVEWQSPTLLSGSNRYVFSGLFPNNWQWRIKSFPTLLAPASPTGAAATTITASPQLANPGLYLTAPDNETFVQLGIVPNAFASDAVPSTEDYQRAYEPYYQSFKQTIESQGSRNTISDVTNVGALYRATFVARNDAGATNTRGVLFIRSAGRHLLMTIVTLGPNSAIKQNLVDGYEADLQTLALSIKVSTPN